MGKKNTFENFRNSLKTIHEIYGSQLPLNKEGYSRIQVSMVLNRYNMDETQSIRKYCRKKGYIFCCKTPGKKGKAKDQWYNLIGKDELKLQYLGKKYSDREQTTSNIEGKCSIASYGIAITRTGDIALCETARNHNIGNIREKPFIELSQKRQKIFDSYGCPACIAKYIHNGNHATSMFYK